MYIEAITLMENYKAACELQRKINPDLKTNTGAKLLLNQKKLYLQEQKRYIDEIKENIGSHMQDNTEDQIREEENNNVGISE
jgi:hypothetical protein